MQFRFKWPLWIIYMFIFLTGVSITKANTRADSNQISIGIWRGEILRTDGHVIPFNFQTKKLAGKMIIYVINGTERLMVDQIRQQGDSLFIDMPFFDSHFALRILDDQKLEGRWIKNYGNRQILTPFRAVFPGPERYPAPKTPDFNISGRWSVHFKNEKDSTEAVGEFKQAGSEVKGTFLTITGDYRFLEGVVVETRLKLSTFDGANAYSFESEIMDTNKMRGYFYSGASSVQTWVAEKNEQAKLAG